MLNELSPRPGARHRRKRVGRGPGSGKGKTSGTGVKGQGTRSGQKIKPGSRAARCRSSSACRRRVPEPLPRREQIVNLGQLAVFGENAEVDPAALAARGLIRGTDQPVKVLAEGEAPKGLKLKVQKISASARAKIEAAGGSVEIA
ncbi:MAG: 50S ribosomal protein L15 [Myxococcota bacterium]